MRAVIMHAPHEMRVGEWQTPRPTPGEAVITVKAAGICGSDMGMYEGKFSTKLGGGIYPRVAGHEVAGVVSQVGENVTRVKVGDRVAVEPVVSCGKCYPCRVGKYNCCTNMQMIGGGRDGGFSEYLLAPEANLHVVPSEMSMTLAACVEPTAIGLQACRRGGISPGEQVLVLGCGPIGLAVIEIAKALGARVVASDILPSRLDAAAKLGVEIVIGGEGLVERIMDHTNGEGAPVVVEAVGLPPVIEQTVPLVASGGRIVIVGVIKDGSSVTTDGRAWTGKEMTVLGSRNSVNCFPECIRLIMDGKVTFPRLAMEHSLWEAPKIFEDMSRNPGLTIKNVLVA